MTNAKSIPSVSVSYARTGRTIRSNELGMRPMQERAWEKRGEQYLLIKSPPASGKSRALMFIALDKLANQGVRQAVIVVPEKTIGASFSDMPLSRFGFWADWTVRPKWNLCSAPGTDGGKVKALKAFLGSNDRVLVCTHATFRFAVDQCGVGAFDDRLVAVDEFHHASANPDNRLGVQVGQLMARDKAHIVAMTGSYFRGDAEPVLMPEDEERFQTVTYTYYEQLNGYEHLKRLDIGYFFYTGSYVDDILKVLDPSEKTIVHIPSVNSRESTKDKVREVEHIIEELGEWKGADPETGFQLVETAGGRVLRIADLVDDNPARRDRVAAALRDPRQKEDRQRFTLAHWNVSAVHSIRLRNLTRGATLVNSLSSSLLSGGPGYTITASISSASAGRQAREISSGGRGMNITLEPALGPYSSTWQRQRKSFNTSSSKRPMRKSIRSPSRSSSRITGTLPMYGKLRSSKLIIQLATTSGTFDNFASMTSRRHHSRDEYESVCTATTTLIRT